MTKTTHARRNKVYCPTKVSTHKMETADNTRKRKDISSVSELDTSGATNTSPNIGKKQKKKKKTKSGSETETGEPANKETHEAEKQHYIGVSKQLEEINKKLSNVLRKDDGFLKDLIKEVFQQMKDEFLLSVYKRIEILEGRLFEKDQDNDKLLGSIDQLKQQIEEKNSKIEEQKVENQKLREQIEKTNMNFESKMNDMEQYSRKNSLRISGIREIGFESAEETIENVTETLNKAFKHLNLQNEHINIAHRLGKKKNDPHATAYRQIIVKFHSRMIKDSILKRRRALKGSNIFISEDLTPIKQQVLACLRKKMPDEVDQSWSRNGRLFYKAKSNKDKIIEVQYKDFQMWLDLPWPKQ